MARKVFQHFADVLCQQFVETPSNRDLVNLVLMGGGELRIDILTLKSTCNRYPVSPLPYAEDARAWLMQQMERKRIPPEQLSGAGLIVDYSVALTVGGRPDKAPMSLAAFDLKCVGAIRSPDRTYTSERTHQANWSLGWV